MTVTQPSIVEPTQGSIKCSDTVLWTRAGSGLGFPGYTVQFLHSNFEKSTSYLHCCPLIVHPDCLVQKGLSCLGSSIQLLVNYWGEMVALRSKDKQRCFKSKSESLRNEYNPCQEEVSGSGCYLLFLSPGVASLLVPRKTLVYC